MKRNVIALATVAVAAVAAPPAAAGIMVGDSGFVGSVANTVDFENSGLQNDTVVTNQFSGATIGVTFGGMVFRPNGLPCNEAAQDPAITGNGCIGNFPPQVLDPANSSNSIPAGTNPWTMTFGSDLDSLAFGLSTNTLAELADVTEILIELFDGAFDSGNAVATATVGYSTPTGASKFVQVTGFTFDRVRVTVDLPGTLPDVMRVDNLQFSAPSNDVPEPGTLALAAMAVGSLCVASGRRRGRGRPAP